MPPLSVATRDAAHGHPEGGAGARGVERFVDPDEAGMELRYGRHLELCGFYRGRGKPFFA